MQQRTPRGRYSGVQVHALKEEQLVDVLLHLRAQRLEEHQDDDRGQDRVQVHGVEAAYQHHEHVEDTGEREGQGRRHHELAEDLVEIEQPLARHRLCEHEQEDYGEHGSNRRQRRADEPQEVP